VITEVAQYVNDTKSRLENRQRLWQLHCKLQCDPLAKKKDKVRTRPAHTHTYTHTHTHTRTGSLRATLNID
jgi:hypothetical protein